MGGNIINLLDYRENRYSTIGNDGIIKYIFDRLDIKEGIFVEFGAWDGVKNSNCRGLFEDGWQGIFIENDKDKYEELKNNYKEYTSKITCLNEKIGNSGKQLFDEIVDPVLNGKNIDFCSIDIDGLDLEVFETIEKYLPIVVCIEGGQMLHPFAKRVKKKIAKRNIQQSLNVMVESFEDKGYKILCSYQDSFFIKKDFYDLFLVSKDILTLYFDGLRAISKRMPFVQQRVGRVGIKNRIVDYVLKRSKYNSYGWSKRKLWAKEMPGTILRVIDEVENIERRKL